MRAILYTIFFLIVFNTNVYAKPRPTKDLNKQKTQQSSLFQVQSGNKIFFSRKTPELGEEIWVTDGTAAGTVLLKDIVPGTGSSSPTSFAAATFAGTPGVYFTATTPANGTELWVSDGTTAGTQMLLDINPGADSSIMPFSTGQIATRPDLSTVFFAANNGVNGTELWTSEGTAGTTTLVVDIEPGAGSSSPADIRLFPTFAVFSASTLASGNEPYVTNGVLTLPVGDLNPGASPSHPSNFFQVSPAQVIFAANDGVNGTELWQVAGGASLLANLEPGQDSSSPAGFTAFPSGDVLFSAFNIDAGTGQLTNKIYVTDGTAPGTIDIATPNCLPGGLFMLFGRTVVETFKALGSNIVFPCSQVNFGIFAFTEGESELWVSDGTAPGTQKLKDIFPGVGSAEVNVLLPGNNRVVFPANDGVTGLEPWVSDGTAAGTNILQDFNQGEASSITNLNWVTPLILPGNAHSNALIMPLTIGTDQKVYYTDGTAANTMELFDDSDNMMNLGSFPENFTALKNRVVFAATHTTKGRELYVTNGKRKGAKIAANINTSGNSDPENFKKFNKKTVFFTARTPEHGRELWRTGGTKKSTKRILDIKPGAISSDPILFDGKLKGKMLFTADDGVNGFELWSTNGKAGGTSLIKDINPGTSSSGIQNLIVFKQKAYLQADDGTRGGELWVSDGSNAGTQLLVDLEPGAIGSSPNQFVIFKKKIYFTAFTTANGNELYVSDGTAAGTQLFMDINPGAGNSFPSNLTVVGKTLFFSADNGVNGSELWRTDGTAAGTFLVEDINPGAGSSSIEEITKFRKNRILFAADNGTVGKELWTATGQANSADLLKDINPGAASAFGGGYFTTKNFVKIPGKKQVYFSAQTAANGTELWRTNGTIAGTKLVGDIDPGTNSSFPGNFLFFKDLLLFSAMTEKKGCELFFEKIRTKKKK